MMHCIRWSVETDRCGQRKRMTASRWMVVGVCVSECVCVCVCVCVTVCVLVCDYKCCRWLYLLGCNSSFVLLKSAFFLGQRGGGGSRLSFCFCCGCGVAVCRRLFFRKSITGNISTTDWTAGECRLLLQLLLWRWQRLLRWFSRFQVWDTGRIRWLASLLCSRLLPAPYHWHSVRIVISLAYSPYYDWHGILFSCHAIQVLSFAALIQLSIIQKEKSGYLLTNIPQLVEYLEGEIEREPATHQCVWSFIRGIQIYCWHQFR
jgi:hypothetical protein